jgi:Holliday junction DNA helicase RuvA
MINAITGELVAVADDRAQLKAGALVFDLLVPASDLTELSSSIGREITFHTILDFEGDPTRGNLAPRLIGFLRPQDKQFFELFTTVKGIGPKKALRALAIPVSRIARAIESKNSSELANLQGIGKRMAELIVAELSGKAQAFAASSSERISARSPVDEDAILVCVQLGLARHDVERMLEKVKQTHPHLTSAEGLSREMLRMRAAV